MDCPLSTWPSITQYDDFSWAGLGDIDPLESLDRSLDNDPGTSLSNSQETKPSMPPANTESDSDTLAQISHTQGSNLYRLRSSESLAAARWDSINAVDLESVLDTTFPSQDASTTPSGENVYDLYSDGILNDVDAFMSDSMSDGAEGSRGLLLPHESLQMNASAMTPDMVFLSSSQEDTRCENVVVDGDSPISINVPPLSISNPVPIMVDRNAQHDVLDNAGGSGVQMVQPYPFNPIHGDPCPSSQSPLDLKESMFSQQLHDIQPNRVMPWPNTTSTSAHSQVFDGEKVHRSPLHVRDNYPAIMEQQVRLADAARVELKRNRAQASRARRLAASQRRAKKYPLQKLIRMSSSPSGARDRLDQNLVGAATIPHPPLQMVSQGQFAGGVQPLSRSILNSQVPGFLPVVLRSPHLASSNHELLPQSNPLQAGPYYCYQQTLVGPLEDNRVQSGSGAVQSMTDQDVQSMTSTPSMALSRATNSTQCLDAAVLEQLQSTLGKMNVDMRLCIRDALYRLANSSKHRQNRMDSASDSSSSHNEAMETNTNPIDRWIVNILFCKQPTSFQLDPQLYAHTLTQAGGPSVENVPTDSSSQQWNSCGSSVNLQEQPLHVLTGL